MSRSKAVETSGKLGGVTTTRPAFSIHAASPLVKKTLKPDISVEEAKKNIQSMLVNERCELAESANLPPQVAMLLGEDRSLRLRSILSANPVTPEALMLKLAKDPQPFPRKRLLENPSATSAVLEVLLEDADQEMFVKILKHEHAPQSVLTKGMASEDWEVRQTVAKSESATPEMLDKLASDAEESVREAVALNVNTSEQTLVRLAKEAVEGTQAGVARELASRQGLSKEVIDTLLTFENNPDVLTTLVFNNQKNPNLTTETLIALATPEGVSANLVSTIIDTGRLPQDIVDGFLEDTDRDVVRSAIKLASKGAITERLGKAIEEAYKEDAWGGVGEILKHAEAVPFDEIADKYLNEKTGENGVHTILRSIISNPAAPASALTKAFNFLEAVPEEEWGYDYTSLARNLSYHQNVPKEVIRTMVSREGDRYNSFKNGLIQRLPVSEQVRLSSKTPKWFSDEPERAIDYKRYSLRQLQKAMEQAGLSSMKKADLGKEPFQMFKGKPAIEDLFNKNKGVITLDLLESYLKEAKGKGQGYYVHHSTYSPSVQSDKIFDELERYVYAVGLKDIEGDEELVDFVEKVAPTMQHAGHTIGLAGKNLGWVLYKKVPKDIAEKLGVDQAFFLIEQVQSDWRGFFQKIRDAIANTELARNVREEQKQALEYFESKYGEDGIVRVQKSLDKLVKDYPEKILSAFLEDAVGNLVFMTDKDKIRSLTSMSPTTAKIIYEDTAKKFGFKESTRIPGYLEMVASNYQDDVTEVGPIENNYSTHEQDSNFSVKNRPRPTRKEDKHIRRDSKVPTGEREPVDYDVYTGLGNMMYPLGGSLGEQIEAAVGEIPVHVDAGNGATLFYRLVESDTKKRKPYIEVSVQLDGEKSRLQGLQWFLVKSGKTWVVESRSAQLEKMSKEQNAAWDEVVLSNIPEEVGGEKVEEKTAKSYNLMTDPRLDSLEPKLTEQEKMFVNITKWGGAKNDTFLADAERLDSATLDVLKQRPKGEGTYFSWRYTSQEDLNTGKGLKDSSPSVYVVKKKAWDEALDLLRKKDQQANEQPAGASPKIEVVPR